MEGYLVKQYLEFNRKLSSNEEHDWHTYQSCCNSLSNQQIASILLLLLLFAFLVRIVFP